MSHSHMEKTLLRLTREVVALKSINVATSSKREIKERYRFLRTTRSCLSKVKKHLKILERDMPDAVMASEEDEDPVEAEEETAQNAEQYIGEGDVGEDNVEKDGAEERVGEGEVGEEVGERGAERRSPRKEGLENRDAGRDRAEESGTEDARHKNPTKENNKMKAKAYLHARSFPF